MATSLIILIGPQFYLSCFITISLVILICGPDNANQLFKMSAALSPLPFLFIVWFYWGIWWWMAVSQESEHYTPIQCMIIVLKDTTSYRVAKHIVPSISFLKGPSLKIGKRTTMIQRIGNYLYQCCPFLY